MQLFSPKKSVDLHFLISPIFSVKSAFSTFSLLLHFLFRRSTVFLYKIYTFLVHFISFLNNHTPWRAYGWHVLRSTDFLSNHLLYPLHRFFQHLPWIFPWIPVFSFLSIGGFSFFLISVEIWELFKEKILPWFLMTVSLICAPSSARF